MSLAQDRQLFALTATAVGAREAAALFGVLDIDPALAAPQGETVSRAVFAMAMNAVLFHDLLARAPTGAAYVEDVRQAGGRVIFDHTAPCAPSASARGRPARFRRARRPSCASSSRWATRWPASIRSTAWA